MKKRGQSQIITTILIILLVLAAIVIVWQAVKKNVETGTAGIDTASACMTLNLEVEATVGTTNNLVVKRGVGGADVTPATIRVIKNGAAEATDRAFDKKELEQITYSITLAAGDKVEIAPVIDGNLCPVAASDTA